MEKARFNVGGGALFFSKSIYPYLLTVFVSALSGCRCSTAKVEGKRDVNLFIWAEYTSPTLLKEFESKTGYRVVETNFASNEELLAKLQAGATGYDVVIPSDYMIPVMAKLGLLQRLDKTKMPNMQTLDKRLLGRNFDPTNAYSLPYSWSLSLIAWNKKKWPKGILGYQDLLKTKDLMQKVAMLDDVREVIAAALRMQGFSGNSKEVAELTKAKDLLLAMKPQIKEFNSTPVASLLQGDLIAAQIYANEAMRLMAKHPDFEVVVPEEGFTFAIDNFAIPSSATNVDGAHQFINFLLEPANNKRFVEELLAGAVVPIALKDLPAVFRNHPTILSDGAFSAKGEMLEDLGDSTSLYDRIWTEVKAAAM